MKFGNEFRIHLEESIPEWQDKFLCYKPLKKFLKRLPSGNQFPPPNPQSDVLADSVDTTDGADPSDGPFVSADPRNERNMDLAEFQDWFVRLLNEELEKFNDFYVEKEEEFVIRRHWMLCAIHPHKQTVYWLDSLGGKPWINIKDVVAVSLKIWIAQNNPNKPSKSTKWIKIKCPKQTNNIDCGYDVLRFIKEVINRGLDYIPEKYYPDVGKSYGKDQIDEIRDQWTSYVQRFID